MAEEITAEYPVGQLAPRAELKVRLSVSVGAKTDMGRVRENNEDKYEFFIPDDEGELASRGMIFVVCDGMGGHEAGQIASELAVKTFIDNYRNHPAEDAEMAARSAAIAANRFVNDVALAIPSRKGMGTTLSALMLIQDRALTAQVGDSRVYRLRDGEIAQITPEHTWIEETVAAGLMTRADAENHPYKHVITRAIGVDPEVTPDVAWHDLREGDVYLLCSDGLTNHVPDEALARTLAEFGPSESAWRLVSAALIDGGSDNATAIVVRVDALGSVP